MKVFEIISLNKEFLNRLTENGIKPKDYKYIPLYQEYEQRRKDGEKQAYIVAVLTEKYDISERTFYRVLKKFQAPAKI